MDTPLHTTASPPADATSRGRGRAGSRREQVYADLRRRLMIGEFGVQTRLGEERLAADLGVSRTPVREALIRLAADGLLVRRDSGYFPVLPDLTDLRDLYELRITIELRGLARAIESDTVAHDATMLETLLQTWQAIRNEPPAPDPQFVLVDEDFHVTLSRASGNPALTEALKAVNARIRPVRMYDFLTEDRIESTITEHLEIVELTLDRRLNEALAALHRHVGESMEVVEQLAVRAFAQMARHRGRS
jgi:DNA-binding GntR family transcriptional regulator